MPTPSLSAISPWSLVLGLHIVCVAVWVGGMVFSLLVVRSSLAVLESAPRVAVHNQMFRRFFLIVWHVMPLTLLTGYAMLFGLYGGFRGAGWPIHAMHGLGLIMAIIFLVIFYGPWRRFRAAVSPARTASSVDTIRKLVLVNVVLGVVTTFIAALGAQ